MAGYSSEMERRHQERMAVSRASEKERERPDPTEWAPKGWRQDWDQHETRVDAEEYLTSPLTYGSLADNEPGTIAAIEAAAKMQALERMNADGYFPDERTLRPQWQIRVTGYGYQIPDGFIHPEAPDDIKRQVVAAWKRCVEMASDSMSKTIFVRVWRRKHRALPEFEVRALGAPTEDED